MELRMKLELPGAFNPTHIINESDTSMQLLVSGWRHRVVKIIKDDSRRRMIIFSIQARIHIHNPGQL